MALFSGSPVMSEKKFTDATFSENSNTMTIEGTIIRTVVLLFCVVAAAIVPWTIFFETVKNIPDETGLSVAMNSVKGYIGVGLIGGLVLALIISFKPTLAGVLAIPYALAEGLAIGALSAFYEGYFPGIVMQAAASTFAVFFVMLLLYYKRIIVPTQKFKAVVTGAILAIALVYLVSMVMSFWGSGISVLYDNSAAGILVSAVICIIAALSLIMDFEVIEKSARAGAPKYMSWYGAFAMMVTLIWLYLEILRLLAKLRSRD